MKISTEIENNKEEIRKLTKEIKKYALSLEDTDLFINYNSLISFGQQGIRLGVRLKNLEDLEKKYEIK